MGAVAQAFDAVFEVYPEVKLGDMSAAEVERPVLEVTDAEVDKTLEILRKQRIRYEAVDRAAATQRPERGAHRHLARPGRERSLGSTITGESPP